MNREDFPILKNNKMVYLDNGATTLKPQQVIDTINDYYTKYTANAHRGDYDNSLKVDIMYENTRQLLAKFINANTNEIVFTKGATESLNMIVFGFMKYFLKKGDEILLTKSEHASNILPWLELEKEIGVKVKYIELDSNYKVSLDLVERSITKKTKVISLAHITNVIGDIRPIKEISKICRKMGIYLVVDGAQSVAHMKTDVKDLDIDFLAFSGHKMLGPTGIGVLYGKYELLDKMRPLNFGGGMNNYFESTGNVEYKSVPTKFEAGTPNIEGVLGLGSAVDYIMKIGIDNIFVHEQELRKYLIEKLETIDNITIYNKNSEAGIVAFNINNIFAQDTAVYLNHYKICVRAGNHCAKMLKEEMKIKNTCRVTLYLYNNKEEIDKLIEVLRNNKDIFKVVI